LIALGKRELHGLVVRFWAATALTGQTFAEFISAFGHLIFLNSSYKFISEYVFFPPHPHLIRTTVISFRVFHNLIRCLSLWAHRLRFTERWLL